MNADNIMNDIKTIYDSFWEKASQEIIENKIQVDLETDNPKDTRRGITLLLEPDKLTADNITPFVQAAFKLEPEQYFYPATDYDITILSIISCVPGFLLQDVNIDDYCDVIAKCAANIEPLEIELKGITSSPSAVMIQGFPINKQLEALRNSIRQIFKETKLYNSIDTRYILTTSHMTVIRFRSLLNDSVTFHEFLSKNRKKLFGTLYCSNIKLVFNDWYQRRENTKVLASYNLRKQGEF